MREDIVIVEIDPPLEVIEEVARVDVFVVTKLASAKAFDVFIFPVRLTLLRLAVVTQLRYAVLT